MKKNLILLILLIIIDFLSKLYFINKNIYIFKYFSLTYLKNTGVAFGLFKGNNFIFIILSLIIIFIIIYFYKDKSLRLGLDLILAGAIGNLISRIIYGYVIDFIDFKIWPVFNLADIFIVIGVFYLIIKLCKS